MKVSIKFFLSALGFVACMAIASGCNKGYGCPSDFSVDARTEVPSSIIPSC